MPSTQSHSTLHCLPLSPTPHHNAFHSVPLHTTLPSTQFHSTPHRLPPNPTPHHTAFHPIPLHTTPPSTQSHSTHHLPPSPCLWSYKYSLGQNVFICIPPMCYRLTWSRSWKTTPIDS
ncbi:hypothetical protein Pcinc_043236 [Petrolisthes cinctipes]|uniref:Uncharacterized protein n=1 Tax=Petrolisthes cinctipes TaxID=88211 RepID=A0AAE1EI29_PETCI|nr:hypothetical protein Pcinc_043236 [Petrolisthes cinctipes]